MLKTTRSSMGAFMDAPEAPTTSLMMGPGDSVWVDTPAACSGTHPSQTYVSGPLAL